MHITGIGFFRLLGVGGKRPDGAQPLTFEGGWKAEQAPFRGCGGTDRKERLFVRVKKYRIMFISVYFCLFGVLLFIFAAKTRTIWDKKKILKRQKTRSSSSGSNV